MSETLSSDEFLVRSQWRAVCRSAQSHGELMARMASTPFAELIAKETSAFCKQEAATTSEELSNRQLQSLSLTSKISSISHANSMAGMHPRVAREILDETKAFCKRVNDGADVSTESLALTSTISSICHTDLMQRLS